MMVPIVSGEGNLPPGDPGQGEALYRQYCAVCHGATGEGDGPNAPFLEDDRPRDLTDAKYMGRLTDRDLAEVIRGGGGGVGRSRFMPAWGNTLSPQQVGDVVAYTRALSRQPQRPMAGPADPPAAAGARQVAELGCTGCHRIGDLPAAPVAPDLSRLGAKLQRAWLEAYLSRPHAIRPAGYVPLSRSRMPDFRLSPQESRQLTAYLIRLRPEGVLPVGSVQAPAEADGSALLQRLACRACHALGGRGGLAAPDLSLAPQRLQPAWVARYLLDPQAADPRSPMPRPGITPSEASILAAYLSGGIPSPTAAEPDARDEEAVARGGALFRDLACRGCHRRPDEELPERVGPDLTFIGDRLRPDWIAGFLRQPHPVRPWLRARMPTFGFTDVEVEQVTAFLAALRDKGLPPLPSRLQAGGVASPEILQAGARLASQDYLSCSSCHLGGDRSPEGPADEWAPDLRLAARRLRPEWIVRWLLDPQRLLPGTKMPSYFPDADSGPNDILDGEEDRQILALRDFLLTLGKALDSPVP
ncbi:MAG: c-type cytochrome [candidate division NC10 bacterium]|nr:c-type cytochrome [candidate division NC10 bacterium]